MNNLPRQKLCEIIKIYGTDVCNDRKRMKGLLNDYCSGDYPEIEWLMNGLEENANTKLLKLPKNIAYEYKALASVLVECLNKGRKGMDPEKAHWVVDSWALALGVISNETPYIKPEIPFSEAQSSIPNTIKSSSSTTTVQTLVVSQSGQISDCCR